MISATEHFAPCGTCETVISHLGARGKTALCANCQQLVVDADGNSVSYSEGFKSEVLADGTRHLTMMGPDLIATIAATGKSFELGFGTKLFVGSQAVKLYEGVAGWIGFVLVEKPAKPRL